MFSDAIRRLSQRLGLLAGVCLVAGACAFTRPPTVTPRPSQANVIALPTTLPDNLTYEQTLPLFEYDRSVPFAVQEKAAYPVEQAVVHDITYMGANGVVMPAYLVIPTGQGPFAGVLWMGWTGGYSQIREEFLQESINLATKGVASILVAGYFPWYVTPRDKDSDRAGMIGQVRELRRALDLLTARAKVDPGRIAFVGHSMSAMHGATLTAVDRRIKAAVLMAPNDCMADWIFMGYGLDPATEKPYRAAMAPFDPTVFLPHAAPAALFFQFGADDLYVTQQAAKTLYEAASQPKLGNFYSGGHDLDSQAMADRDRWLAAQLGLKGWN